MNIEPNELLNMYCREKQLLHLQRERKELTEKEYVDKFSNVDKLWRIEFDKHMSNYKLKSLQEEEQKKINLFAKRQQEVQYNTRKKKMTETQTVEKVKKIKTPRTNSQAALIEKALMMKTVKSYEDVANKVFEWDSTKDKKKVISQTKIIINIVKNQSKPRWKGYVWNEVDFLLTKNN
jgi:hypothetical protein